MPAKEATVRQKVGGGGRSVGISAISASSRPLSRRSVRRAQERETAASPITPVGSADALRLQVRMLQRGLINVSEISNVSLTEDGVAEVLELAEDLVLLLVLLRLDQRRKAALGLLDSGREGAEAGQGGERVVVCNFVGMR